MIKLIDSNETYELPYPVEGEEEGTQTIFIMKKLSGRQKNRIDDQLTRTGGGKSTTMHYLGGTAREMKIDYCLVDWKNVTGKDGNAMPCNSENKGSLSSEIQDWLEDHIDATNKLRGVKEEDRKKS